MSDIPSLVAPVVSRWVFYPWSTLMRDWWGTLSNNVRNQFRQRYKPLLLELNRFGRRLERHIATGRANSDIVDHKVPENRALLTDFDRNGQNSDPYPALKICRRECLRFQTFAPLKIQAQLKPFLNELNLIPPSGLSFRLCSLVAHLIVEP